MLNAKEEGSVGPGTAPKMTSVYYNMNTIQRSFAGFILQRSVCSIMCFWCVSW